MGLKTDMRIVLRCGRGGEQYQLGVGSKTGTGGLNQFPANAAPLVGHIHREIRNIATEGKIRNRSGQADHKIPLPSGRPQIGVPNHLLHSPGIIHGTTFGESRTPEQVNKLMSTQCNISANHKGIGHAPS